MIRVMHILGHLRLALPGRVRNGIRIGSEGTINRKNTPLELFSITLDVHLIPFAKIVILSYAFFWMKR